MNKSTGMQVFRRKSAVETKIVLGTLAFMLPANLKCVYKWTSTSNAPGERYANGHPTRRQGERYTNGHPPQW